MKLRNITAAALMTVTAAASANDLIAEANHGHWTTSVYNDGVAASVPGKYGLLMLRQSYQDCSIYTLTYGELAINELIPHAIYEEGYEVRIYFDSNRKPVFAPGARVKDANSEFVYFTFSLAYIPKQEQRNLHELMRRAKNMTLAFSNPGGEHFEPMTFSLSGSKAAMDDARISCHRMAERQPKQQQKTIPAFQQIAPSNDMVF